MSVEHAVTPPPASGAWREGDPAGHRRWIELERPLPLEAGGRLPGVRIAYETWGTPAPDRSNAVLILHALTGDSHVAGPAGPGHPTAGWWDELVGAGRVLDPRHWYIVVPNVLGGCQGSTGPASLAPDGRPWGSRFPSLTVRDQVRAEAALADALGVDRWAAVIGGSMGGNRALEWAVTHPDRVATLGLLACSATASADQIAWTSAQLAAITGDPGWCGGDYHDAPAGHGPHRGLALARQIAHVTYRSGAELDSRFGRRPQGAEDPLRGGRYAVESYLDHHGHKLVRRFDAGSYVTLAKAMNSHDVGRDRGGVARALSRVRARTLVIAVDSDRLFPTGQQHLLAAGIAGADIEVISSAAGHDGFLLETDAITHHLRHLLGPSGQRPDGPRLPRNGRTGRSAQPGPGRTAQLALE